MKRAFGFGFILAGSVLAACGDSGAIEFSSASSTGASTVDTRYHPKGDGVPMMEAEACEQLQTALSDGVLKVGCVATVQQCPGLLRALYQTACMQYDAGTVKECAAYYGKLTTCDELTPENCVLIGFPTTAPFGCPEA